MGFVPLANDVRVFLCCNFHLAGNHVITEEGMFFEHESYESDSQSHVLLMRHVNNLVYDCKRWVKDSFERIIEVERISSKDQDLLKADQVKSQEALSYVEILEDCLKVSEVDSTTPRKRLGTLRTWIKISVIACKNFKGLLTRSELPPSSGKPSCGGVLKMP
ncbi:hypothetical protein N665_0582s0007 [Sinapis alba]|nr:hypothetical protein N665_0582s0007 [Sinapis alba]